MMTKCKALQRTHDKTDRDLHDAGIQVEEIINENKEESMKKEVVQKRKNEN